MPVLDAVGDIVDLGVWVIARVSVGDGVDVPYVSQSATGIPWA